MSDGTGPSGGDAKATVLVVDDNQQLREVYRKQLDGQFRVLTAAGGREALEAIDESVDVVVLDRCMPGLSGDEVFEQLIKRSSRPSVVMITGMDMADPTPAPERSLVKPAGRDELISAIDELVSTQTQNAVA
jgi:CheY-like chemotaxis protein